MQQGFGLARGQVKLARFHTHSFTTASLRIIIIGFIADYLEIFVLLEQLEIAPEYTSESFDVLLSLMLHHHSRFQISLSEKTVYS